MEHAISPLTDGMVGARCGGFYLSPYTNFRLTAFNSAAGVTLLCSGQILGRDGEVRPFQFTLIPTTARAISTAIFTPGDGWLIDVQLVASAGTPRRGQCFARLELIAGREAATHALATVLQGYVQDTTALAWPGSRIGASPDGPGVIRSITGTDPAANVEISETVPTNARWRLLSIYATLVTDATVATRVISWVIDDGAANVWAALDGQTQTATQTVPHVAADFGQAIISTNVIGAACLPSSLRLMGGFRIRTSTALKAAGDNWSAPQLLVEEWIED